MDIRTTHDFNTENIIEFILTGFNTVNKPPSYFIFSIIYKGCLITLYGFLLIMTVYTMSIARGDKFIQVQAFHSLCLTLLAIMFFSAKQFTDQSLYEATKLIKEGIFKYSNEDSTDPSDVLTMRVAQIRLVNSAFKKLFTFCAMVYIFIFPLIQKLTLQDTADKPLNPYLPLTLYLPFNTRTYLGFTLAFISIAVFYILLYLTGHCSMVIYTSCTMQLIAQIEVLNKSLIDIENRAISKLMTKTFASKKSSSDNLYNKTEFQNCLYSCLRENILHHHAILRFKKTVCPFLETLNGICLLLFSATMAATIFLIAQGRSSDFTMFAFLLAEIVCVLLISLIGETITDKSKETAQFLYATPWPDCDDKFKMLLKIMAAYLRTPIYLKTKGFSSVSSLETFRDMMSAGYKLTSVLY